LEALVAYVVLIIISGFIFGAAGRLVERRASSTAGLTASPALFLAVPAQANISTLS
jgi:hypothetical protein